MLSIKYKLRCIVVELCGRFERFLIVAPGAFGNSISFKLFPMNVLVAVRTIHR